jgi:hypothetical protein
MLYRVNFNVVAGASRFVVTNDLVYLETIGPLYGPALRKAAVEAIAQEYDLHFVDLDSITIEGAGLDEAVNW